MSACTIETMLVDIPTIRPHQLAMTTMRTQTLVLVRIRTPDGITGWGEGTTIGGLSYGDESPEGIQLAIETYLAPIVRAGDPTRIGATMAELSRHVRGNHHAKCAIEMALLDAAGKRANVPLSELLGGRRRERLEVAWTLASGDTATDIAEAEAMLERRRHRVFKLKIGAHDPRADFAHVAAIQRALGERARVRVDVNQAWTEADAMWGVAALEAAGIELVEQPVARHQHAALQRIAARHAIPVMADESLHGPEDAFALAALAAVDVFAVKPAPSGGLAAAARVAAIAEAAGIGLYGGTLLEGPVGTAAAAQLFATFSSLAWGTELFGPLLLTEELLREPLHYADFALTVPTDRGWASSSTRNVSPGSGEERPDAVPRRDGCPPAARPRSGDRRGAQVDRARACARAAAGWHLAAPVADRRSLRERQHLRRRQRRRAARDPVHAPAVPAHDDPRHRAVSSPFLDSRRRPLTFTRRGDTDHDEADRPQ